MFRARHTVKFAACGLCLKCNVRKGAIKVGNCEGNDAGKQEVSRNGPASEAEMTQAQPRNAGRESY